MTFSLLVDGAIKKSQIYYHKGTDYRRGYSTTEVLVELWSEVVAWLRVIWLTQEERAKAGTNVVAYSMVTWWVEEDA